MLLQIDFLNFKNILNKNNVLLFDSQLRIAHFRFNKYINNMPQIGGGIKNNLYNPDLLLNKIYQKKNCLLSHFIDSLVSNNLTRTNFIINSLNY